MSKPASKAKSKNPPVRLGRSPLTGSYIIAPYPKKGGTDPKIVREAVRAVIASRKA